MNIIMLRFVASYYDSYEFGLMLYLIGSVIEYTCSRFLFDISFQIEKSKCRLISSINVTLTLSSYIHISVKIIN